MCESSFHGCLKCQGSNARPLALAAGGKKERGACVHACVSEEVIEEVTFLEAADTSGAMRSASLSLQGKRAQRPEKKKYRGGCKCE